MGKAEAWKGILIGAQKLNAARCGARPSLCLHMIAFGAYFHLKERSILDILNTLSGGGGRRSQGSLVHLPTMTEYPHIDGDCILHKS